MKRKSSWALGASVAAGLPLLAASGCVDDLDTLSSQYGKGGAGGHSAGNAGKTGASGAAQGGASAAAGTLEGEAGVAGGAGDEGERGGSGGKGGSAQGGKGGNGGEAGEEAACPSGLTYCISTADCTDLKAGTADGNTVDNCGACSKTCSVAHASGATCNAGICAPVCKPGFADCNAASANDGCEADLASPATCGACGVTCNVNGTSAQQCTSGHCVPTCGTFFADCNGTSAPVPNDGCEVYLDSLAQCTTSCNVAPVACGPTMVCNSGSCVAPAGVAILSVPLTDTTQAQRFADLFMPVPNLEGANVIVRAYAPAATAGTFVTYVSDTGSNFSPTVITTPLSSLSQQWTDIVIPVASLGSFNATMVRQVNLEVHSATGVANPTVVYVDSIRTSNMTINDTFDASFGNLVKSSLVVVTGSSIDWAAAMP